MQQFLRLKYLKVIAVAVIFCLVAHGQLNAQAIDTSSTKHVRLDVARMGLHCPFLGPQLMEKLKQVPSAQNVTLFMQPSYITFDLANGSDVNEAQIADIAAKVGYPKQDITVTINH
jgi:hypothetical protein